MKLRHFGIRVNDMDRSVSFYTGLLELRKLGGGKLRGGGRWTLLEDPKSHHRLELLWFPSPPEASSGLPPEEGLHHIGFWDAHPTSKFRTLIAKGAIQETSKAGPCGPKKQYYLSDPDGNRIALA
ncbi:MAG TPA: VOC family protein [Thermoplasmata archaeon]|nr:VOC family protein [Thermoplasmata archaeon]